MTARGTSWQWPDSPSGQRRYLLQLRLTRQQVTETRSGLGKVVHVCHFQSGLSVARVSTCGSVGKKTASSHSMDLDLVVYLTGLDPKDMQTQFPNLLGAIQKAMDRQYPDTRDIEWYRKFGLRYKIAGMEIDILIGAPNVLPRDFLQVSDPEQSAYMSASVSHLAVRFIKKQGVPFKDLVRVAKDWRDSFPWERNNKPKSYLLEIIMLEACRRLRLTRIGKITPHILFVAPGLAKRTLLKFFELIANVQHYHKGQDYNEHHLPSLFICFTPYYDKEELPLDRPEPLFEKTRYLQGKLKTIKATAIVMDPSNPTNNLWLTLENPSPLVNRPAEAAQQLAKR